MAEPGRIARIRKKYFSLHNRKKQVTIVILILFVLGTLGASIMFIVPGSNVSAGKEAYFNQANTYISQAEYDAAIEELTELINMSSDKVSELVIESYRLRGLAYFMKEEYSSATVDWLKYLEHVPNDADIHYLLGTAYTAMDRDNEALESLTMALLWDSRMVEAYIERSRLLYKDGDLAGALMNLDNAVNLVSGEYQLYLNRGQIHLELENHQEALADFSKAISLSHDDVEAYLYRGDLYYSLSDFENAVKDYSQVIINSPEHELVMDSYKRRGLAYFFLNENESAMADWKTYHEHDTGDIETYYLLGLACSRMEDYELSIQYFTEAITLDEGYGDAYHQRADAYFMLKQHNKAVEDYTKAINLLQTGLDTVYFNRGAAYINLNQRQPAVSDFEKVIAVSTDADLVKEAGNVLAQLKNR